MASVKKSNLVGVVYRFGGSGSHTISIKQISYRPRQPRQNAHYLTVVPTTDSVRDFLATVRTNENLCTYPHYEQRTYSGNLTASFETPLYCNGQVSLTLLIENDLVVWAGPDWAKICVGKQLLIEADRWYSDEEIKAVFEKALFRCGCCQSTKEPVTCPDTGWHQCADCGAV